jgi:phage tail-like protein
MPEPLLRVEPGQDMQALYGNFAFYVQFDSRPDMWGAGDDPQMLGAFSEISGIEATMEHKVIREGGFNYGSRMRAGPVNFGTVILKRGVARAQALWHWWAKFAGADQFADGYPEVRCDVLIGLLSSAESDRPTSGGERPARNVVMGWKLTNAMPVKFRVGDLNAKGSDVAIEELHLVHEGLHVAGVVAP